MSVQPEERLEVLQESAFWTQKKLVMEICEAFGLDQSGYESLHERPLREVADLLDIEFDGVQRTRKQIRDGYGFERRKGNAFTKRELRELHADVRRAVEGAE